MNYYSVVNDKIKKEKKMYKIIYYVGNKSYQVTVETPVTAFNISNILDKSNQVDKIELYKDDLMVNNALMGWQISKMV